MSKKWRTWVACNQLTPVAWWRGRKHPEYKPIIHPAGQLVGVVVVVVVVVPVVIVEVPVVVVEVPVVVVEVLPVVVEVLVVVVDVVGVCPDE